MKLALFHFVLRVTSVIPLKLIHFIGNGIGSFNVLMHSRIYHIAKTNIALCFPELTQQQQKKLLKKSLSETCKTILETGLMWRGDISKTLELIKEVENPHLIKQAREQGQGVILAIPHIGSWELVGLYCAQHYPMTSMYAKPKRKDAILDQAIRDARQRTGAKLVPADNHGIRAMMQALKQQELIAILPDQSPKKNGIFVPFFSRPCYTMTLLPKLAHKTNACVLYAYTKRLNDGSGFKLIFEKSQNNFNTTATDTATAQMNKQLETLIRQTPCQYQWTYKRFKEEPGGKRSIY